MSIIIWLIIGGIIGWLASIIMGRDAQQGILLNIVVGIVGAIIGGYIAGGGSINSNMYDPRAWIFSLVGAVILLAVINLVRRGRLR